MKQLLVLRNKKKAKKPVFLRQDGHKLKKLKKNWRRPKGRDSKMRYGFRSYRKSPSMGYSSPSVVRGLNREGLKEIIVNNINDLTKVKENNFVVVGSGVGLKKRLEILKKIKELKFKCNVKNIDEFIKKALENLENKKAQAKKKAELKEKAKKEALKKQSAKKKEDKPSEDELKEEKKKVLEKKRKGREGEIA